MAKRESRSIAAEQSASAALQAELDRERVAHAATRARLEQKAAALEAEVVELQAEMARLQAQMRELRAQLRARTQ